MPTVPGLCPGRAQCKNYRDFTDLKRRGLAPPPSLQGITPDVVRATIKTLKNDTSGGAGGWTVPLLQLSAKSDRFCMFIATLTQQMANETAPARQQLTSAILIPFAPAAAPAPAAALPG
ncbi:hypothetical protein CF336_g7240 [Tilletia laevis]|uniref:Uncharacterized protein n=1 Tax=Tilletia caries TaxID=13290 RepID=A0A177T1Z4_9BASI|nr:hypothetical protein CF336_g7240 [Tilletia laevis]KAE8240858.1 hypothetical protein A4X03_0g8289 [Tilletia caries]